MRSREKKCIMYQRYADDTSVRRYIRYIPLGEALDILVQQHNGVSCPSFGVSTVDTTRIYMTYTHTPAPTHSIRTQNVDYIRAQMIFIYDVNSKHTIIVLLNTGQ